MQALQFSKLPSPTWNWLKMNEADITGIEYPKLRESQKTLLAGEEDICIMDIKSQKEEDVTGVSFRYKLEKDAKLTLVQIHRLEDKDIFFNDIEGEIGENATFRLIQIFLGGGKVYMGCKNELFGKGARLFVDSAYLVTKDQLLDLNYIANHTGKKTECHMKTDGVLRDRAKKVYRGTINFKRGCSGAIGNENEDVLLMDETVENKTIPIILCAEEDVEGNHGATIGKLDESLLFYMKSRGIPEEEIYEMMAKARIEAVVKKIPDEAVKEELMSWLDDN